MRKYKIKEVLDNQGRTLKWLSKQLGCSYNTVRNYSIIKIDSSTQISKSVIFHISHILEVNPKQIDQSWK